MIAAVRQGAPYKSGMSLSAYPRDERLDGLQALRALAALAVVVFHAGRYVSTALPVPAWHWGEFGVDVFFALSGFVMVYTTRHGASVREFLARRVARIAPMYWLMTLLMAAVLWLRPELFEAAVFSLRHIALSLAFWPHFNPGLPGEVAPLLVPGWTLNYEMYFYLLFALGLVLSLRTRVLAVSAVLLFGVLALPRLMDVTNVAWARFLSDPVALEFAFGMGAALLYLHGWRWPRRVAIVVAVLATVALIVFGTRETRWLSAGVSGVLLVSVSTVWTARGALSLALARLGDASYTLYLTQPFTIGLLWQLWKRLPIDGAGWPGAVVFVLLCLAASTLVAVVAYRWLERPLTRSVQRVLSSAPPRVPESA